MTRCSQQLLFPDPVAWKPIIGLPSLRGCKRISIDCETYDPDLLTLGPGVRRGGYIAGFSVGIEDGPRFYLPIRHEGGGNFDADQTLAWAKDNFEKFDGEVVGAHLLYDLDFFAEEGIEFKNAKRLLDVQVAEPLLDENRFSFGLDTLAKDYLGQSKKESVLAKACADYRIPKKEIKGSLWELPARYVGAYAESDVDLPLKIIKKQLVELEKQGLMELFEVESKLIPILLGMRRRGVPIDERQVERTREFLVAQIKKYQDEASRLASREILVSKKKTFVPYIEKLGLPFERTPKNKDPKINKEWMEQKKHLHPFVECLYQAKKYQHALSTFVDGYIVKHCIKGRIHCEFNQLKRDENEDAEGKKKGRKKGTIARFSSSNPNLQNIPARDPELGPMIRAFFIPEPGEVYEKHDWSQIEYRFLTHYATGGGAEKARQQYRDDPKTDFHEMCRSLAGAVVPKILTMGRKQIKNGNFGVVYGSGIPTMALTLNMTELEAKAFLESYHDALPFVRKTGRSASNAAQKRGYIKTILNRRGRFPLYEEAGYGMSSATTKEKAIKWYGENNIQRAGCFKALSRLLQGSAADLMKKAMVDIYEAGINDWKALGPNLLTCHDELGNSRPRTKAGMQAIRELKNMMETCMTLRVPIIAERESGKSWGTCK